VDLLGGSWRVGAYLGRQRWNTDAALTVARLDFAGWCEYDVTTYSGLRAAVGSRLGRITAAFTSGLRYNVFFQNPSGCPTEGGIPLDVRIRSVSVGVEPLTF
jgi:hypothetical protein